MAKKKEKTLEEKLQEALVPENQWPYMLPENWCWTRLENINEYRGKSVTPQNNDDILFELYSVPSCENEYPEILTGSKIGSSKQLVEKKDVLLCKINPRINRVWQVLEYTNNTLLASSEWIVVRNRLLNSDYLVWYFKSPYFRECMLSNVSGVGGSLMRAKPKAVMEYPVPLAPLSEQKRIVNRIESLFAKLDEAKEKIQQVLDGAEMRKAAILHKAFTGELTKNWRKENGISDDSWNIVLVDDIAQVKGGKRIPKGKNLVTDNTGHPYIKAGNLKNGTVLDSNIMYVPLDVWESIKKYTVNTGDVYITNVGACIGDCGIIPIKFNGANLTENAVKLTDLKCDSLFLSRYIASNLVQRQIKNMIASATLGKLAISKIKTLEVNLPLREEQIQINFILDRQLAIQDNITKLGRNTVEVIDTMKKSILAKAFRGELGTNNPTEDSALNLLKEVLQDKS